MDDVLKPYRRDPTTRAAARVAIGRAWLSAGDAERALALAQQAQLPKRRRRRGRRCWRWS